jgi:hypothetical protein
LFYLNLSGFLNLGYILPFNPYLGLSPYSRVLFVKHPKQYNLFEIFT